MILKEMYILIGGSIKGFGDITYDLDIFLSISKHLCTIIPEKDVTMLFAGSPCSDCLSLQIGKDKGYPIEYHLPCDGNPGEKLMKEYNDIEPKFRDYLLSLFNSLQGKEHIVDNNYGRKDIPYSPISVTTSDIPNEGKDIAVNKRFIYGGHKERNDAISLKCDMFIAVTTFSHNMFLNLPEQIRKNSGTVYVWNKCIGKERYHYSLVSKDMIKM